MEGKKKILFFDYHFPYHLKDPRHPVGGHTVQIGVWCKGFEAIGQPVGMLTFKNANAMIGGSAGYVSLVESYSEQGGLPMIRWLYYRIPSMIKAIRSYQPSYLIQATAGLETGIMAYLGKKLKIPFVYRVANDIDTDQRYKKTLSYYQQLAFRYGLKNADAVLCQNQYQYDNLRERFPQKSMAIFHNPYISTGQLPEINDFKGRKYIAWLGIFQKQKNLPALLQIVKSLPQYEFRIAGKPSKNWNSDLEESVEALRLCKNVVFTGFLDRNEIVTFLSEAYLLLNTSHYEGFSNTFLESFAAGTPVVTTKSVDPNQMIERNKLGITVETFAELPEAIQSLLEKENYSDLAHKCREYVLQNHNPKELAGKLCQFLELLN